MKEIESEITYLIGYIDNEEFYSSHDAKTKAEAIVIRDELNLANTKNDHKQYTIFVKKVTYLELV